MFPTIFTLAIERLGPLTDKASSLLVMAIVGGAIVPLVTGHLADTTSLATSLAIPLVCYLVVAGFGYFEPSKE
jgi:MFS transporter, FHS family, L-fucose permease